MIWNLNPAFWEANAGTGDDARDVARFFEMWRCWDFVD
jgi:hypothetical protein